MGGIRKRSLWAFVLSVLLMLNVSAPVFAGASLNEADDLRSLYVSTPEIDDVDQNTLPPKEAFEEPANPVGSLTWEVIQGENADPNNVITDLALPTSAPDGSTISWASSNPSVVTVDGKVTRPEVNDTKVTLTATITSGGAAGTVDTVQFTVTVRSLSPDMYMLRLIEEDYIEIRWRQRMVEAGAKNPANFKVTMNGVELELDENNCYYYDYRDKIFMTSLKLKNPLSEAERQAFNATLQIVGDVDYYDGGGRADTSRVYKFTYIPFYTQKIDVYGIKVCASHNVKPENLEKIAKIIGHMLKKDQEEGLGIAEKMVAMGAIVGVHGDNENAYFIPGHRALTVNGTNPAAGLGGTVQLPTSSFSQNPSRVVVHEFAHAMKALGLAQLDDKSIIRAYEEAYINVKEQKLYPQGFKYALSNAEEFFAELSTVWFDVYSRKDDSLPTGRDSLKVYDPLTYNVLSIIYPEEYFPPEVLPRTSTSAYQGVPERIFVPEKGVDDTGEEDFDFDTHYFKFYSYLNTNAINYNEPTLHTWWDYSNSAYAYNFDALSWRVTPVEKHGKTYYRFTDKMNGKAMAPIGENVVGAPVGPVPVDENDDSQLWQLVRVKGRVCQIVNKESRLAISTEGGILPADGTPVVLAPYDPAPPYGQQWRVIRLKDAPSRANDDNLFDDKYAIMPIDWDVKMKRISIVKGGFIEIVWSDAVDNTVAANAANYEVTIDGVAVPLDPSQCTSDGDTTRLKLLETPSKALLKGIGAKIKFVGNMYGSSGLPVNNKISYNFRAESDKTDSEYVAATKADLTWDAIKGENADPRRVTSNLVLPTSGPSWTEISWASSNPSVIAVDGTVTRPQVDTEVTLTATITRDLLEGAKDIVEFIVKVKAKPMELLVADAGSDGVVPYSVNANGEKVYVPFSLFRDGKIYFLGSPSTEYFFEARSKSFEDIPGRWSEEHILFMVARGIVNGVSQSEFAPGATLTRGMLVTILARMANAAMNRFEASPFTDVDISAWYGSYAAWAASEGIVTGYGDGTFRPDKAVTREELATMMVRFIDYMGFVLPENEVEPFTDENLCSNWAVEAVTRVHKYGILEGKSQGNFDPTAFVTREEAAKMFHSLITAVLENMMAK